MSNDMIDWSGFRNSMEYAIQGFTKIKEAMANVTRAFESLQTSFEGELPCIATLMVEDTDTWASDMVVAGTVRVKMDANQLVISIVQNDPDVTLVIKDEFVEPIRVQAVLLEPETHEIAYRFPDAYRLRAGDKVSLVDNADTP